MWGWGFDALRFLPRGAGWAIWAAAALLLAPLVARPIAGALDGVDEARRLPLTVAWMAGAALLAW